MRRIWSGFIIRGVAVGIGLSACDSPTDPASGTARRISLEQVITGEISVDDTMHRYSFVASEDGLYGLFLQGLEGRANLVVRGAGGFNQCVCVSLVPRPGELHDEAAGAFELQGGHTYVIEITPVPRGTVVRYRFQPHHINTRPEHRLPLVPYEIGDTISNERLDDILDIDDFRLEGVAREEIALAIKATGSPGTEGITVTLFDPADSFYTYTFTSAGQPGSITGRFSLPATGTYRIRVLGVSGVLGRYAGPYLMWTYRINRAPERHGSALSPGGTITDEHLAPAGDVDEFTFQAPPNSEYNIFLQSKRPALLRLQAFDGSGNYLAFAEAVPADTGLFDHSTGRFARPAGGPVTVRVYGEADHSVADTGAYRLLVYQIDPLPEHHGAAIAPGDTVSGESLDQPGDVDEFSFSGTAGEELNLAFQSLPTSNTFRVEVKSPANESIADVESFFPDTSLFQKVTGTFTLPANGTYRIRVASQDTRYGYDVGPYRFFLYRINRPPETLPATLAIGDSLSGEALDVPGDVDEFRVTVASATGARLILDVEQQLGWGGFTAQIMNSVTAQVIATINADGGRTTSDPFVLASGTYIVRVVGSPYLATMRGPYRVWLN